mgnify:CR=1 FL=1
MLPAADEASSGACVVTTFAELADASQLSSAGQVLLRHAQRRIVASLEAAGFQVAAWCSRANPMSPSVRTVYESLRVIDPLNAEVLDVELRFTLMQVGSRTRLHPEVSVRSETKNRSLTSAELAYRNWDTLDLVDVGTHFQQAFHALAAPEGMADAVFDTLAEKLSLALAP